MGKKLPKDARREQLLDTALKLVEAEGTDALTLARVAELAGVSKPIAYEHFITRGGLLLALFRRFDRKAETAVMSALASGSRTQAQSLAIIASAYINCFVSSGPAFGLILDALSANAETRRFKLDWREELATAMIGILNLSLAERYKLVGLFGAAEALAETAAAGAITEQEAADTLTGLMRSTLLESAA